jgi:hypothetical protein
VSRDAFLTALGDAVDRAELALDRGEGVLSPEARQGLTRDLQDLLATTEAAEFLAAEGLPLAEDELRERLRDLVLDELPDFVSRLPEPPAPVDDLDALARVMVLREVVLPELDVPLPQPPPPPPLPEGEKPQVMFSFAPLRQVGLMTILVGLVMSQLPGPPHSRWPVVLPAELLEPSGGRRLPMMLRLPGGTAVEPTAIHIQAETAGPLVEGVTTMRFPPGLPLGGGAVVEAMAPEGSRVVGFRWVGQAPVPAEPLTNLRYDRGRRTPPVEDALWSWRRQAALPPETVEGPARVQVVWRGQARGALDVSLDGLSHLDEVEVRVRDRLPEMAAVPGWLEEGRPPTEPPPHVQRLEDLRSPGLLRIHLQARMPPLSDLEGLWRWGPRRVISRRAPPLEKDANGLPKYRIPRYEFLVDTSAAGALLATRRVELLRAIAEGGRHFKGQQCVARVLGDLEAAPIPLDAMADLLEGEGFMGPRPRLAFPPPEPGVRRIVVLQGPGVSRTTLAAAAAHGPVAILGQAVDPSLVPGRYPVEGLELARTPSPNGLVLWARLGSTHFVDGKPHPLALAPFEGAASLLGAPLVLDSLPEAWAQPAQAPPLLPPPLPAGGRELGPCEARADERVTAREPELIFGSERQDPAAVGAGTVIPSAPAWSRRPHRPRAVPRPGAHRTDRYAWAQGLQAPRVAGEWVEVRDRADAWRRVDPRNPWPLLYLAEAAIALDDRALAQRALASVPVLTSDPRLGRVAFALALGSGDPDVVRSAPRGTPDDLTRRLDEARALVVLEGAAAAREAYRDAVDAAYVLALAGAAPMSFSEATRAEASVVDAWASGRPAPGLYASLEGAGEGDCLGLRLLDRVGEEVRVEDGVTRGGGRRTSGVAGSVAWARLRGPGDEVFLGVDPGTPGPDGVGRGVLVMLRPGRPGFDVRLVELGSGPARAIHREIFEEREGSR